MCERQKQSLMDFVFVQTNSSSPGIPSTTITRLLAQPLAQAHESGSLRLYNKYQKERWTNS